MMTLDGKVAAIVGGSGGIGAASAVALAQADAMIAIGYHRNVDRARELIERLPGNGHSLFQIAVDDPASVNNAAEEVLARHGRIDILVNSAGTTRPIQHADLNALDDDLFANILSSNVRGPFSTIRAFAPALGENDDGVIINISSISGFTGSGSNVAYCASKGALDIMTMALARALGPKIRVLCVSPGAVATDFVAGRDRAALEKLAEKTPLRRVVEPEHVAQAVLACVTHLTMTTGVRIVVDAGRFLV